MHYPKVSKFFAIPLAFAMAALLAQPAAAQTARKLNCNGCVKSKQVKNNGIKGKDIKDGTVQGADVAGDSIPAADLSNEAGVEFAAEKGGLDLSSTDVTAVSVQLTAPTSGFVVVNASGYFFSGSAGGLARCSITTGTTLDFENFSTGDIVSPERFEPFGMTRGLAVNAGTTTFRLVCDSTDGSMTVTDAQMTAMFFPTRY